MNTTGVFGLLNFRNSCPGALGETLESGYFIISQVPPSSFVLQSLSQWKRKSQFIVSL